MRKLSLPCDRVSGRREANEGGTDDDEDAPQRGQDRLLVRGLAALLGRRHVDAGRRRVLLELQHGFP